VRGAASPETLDGAQTMMDAADAGFDRLIEPNAVVALATQTYQMHAARRFPAPSRLSLTVADPGRRTARRRRDQRPSHRHGACAE